MHIFILTLALLALTGGAASWAGPERSGSSSSIGDRIKRSADYILECQTADGLIAMSPGRSLRAVPYFANLTGLGLLRAYQQTSEKRYLQAVLRYADWYEKHINPDGTIYDFKGTRDHPEPTNDYDSSDAYPATFLSFCWETYRVTKDRAWLKAKYPALVKSVEGMGLTWQEDGLTFAKPDYKVKYLMDNLEVRVGLRAAIKIARELRDKVQIKALEDLLAKNQGGLRFLWIEQEGRFGMAMFEDGNLHREFAKWYPDGMANSFALAYILDPRDPKAKALSAMIDKTFPHAADYWRFAALEKFGPRSKAIEVRNKMGDRLRNSVDHGLYLRALMPEKEGFFFREDILRLPDLSGASRP